MVCSFANIVRGSCSIMSGSFAAGRCVSLPRCSEEKVGAMPALNLPSKRAALPRRGAINDCGADDVVCSATHNRYTGMRSSVECKGSSNTRNTSPPDRLNALFVVGYHLGMRIGELRAVKRAAQRERLE